MAKKTHNIYRVSVWPQGKSSQAMVVLFSNPDVWLDFCGEVRDMGVDFEIDYTEKFILYSAPDEFHKEVLDSALSDVRDQLALAA